MQSYIMQKKLLLLIILLLFSSCKTMGDSSTNFTGIINNQTVDNFVGITTNSYNIVNLNSPGGDPYQALRLAEFLNLYNKPIIIDGVCASACLLLVLASENVTIGEHGLLLAHSSFFTRLHLISRSINNNQRTHTFTVPDEFYTILGYTRSWLSGQQAINPDYFLESTAVTEPKCVGAIVDGKLRLSYNGELSYEANYDFWLPQISTINRWRLNRGTIESYYDYERTLISRLKAHTSFIKKYNLRPKIIDSEVIKAGNWLSTKGNLPLCRIH